MAKLLCKSVATAIALIGCGVLTEMPALADDLNLNNSDPAATSSELSTGNTLDQAGVDTLQQTSTDQGTAIASGMEQVTSVSQLTDVKPTDWAFQALQSLVERYGCIAGYPDRNFRGNRALTRYEFAAGVNACLDRVNELIAAGTANLVKKEDLEALRKLQDEFAAELATLRGRVDALEARTATLEKQQFSTTTKLNVELITYIADAFGDNASSRNETNLGYRIRLDFDTSFTGKDRLRTRLQSTNLRRLDTATQFPIGPLSGGTDESRFLATSVSSNSEVTLNRLQYRFPVGDRLTVYLDANSIDPSIITDPITPFNDQATGSPSNFAQINPIWFPIGNQAGIGFNLVFSDNLQLDFGYQGESGANDPTIGFLNGGYSAFAHLIFTSGTFKIGFMYLNSYSPDFGVDTLAGSNAAKVIGAGPVVADNYGIQFNYKLFPGLDIGGWAGLTQARALGGGTKGDADVWNYALNIAFPDLFKKGSLGGLVFGMQPRLTGTSNSALAQAIGLPVGQRKDRDTGFHIEAFYRYPINDNISITPGIIWLTAPNHDDRNPDVVIGVIRTTFLF